MRIAVITNHHGSDDEQVIAVAVIDEWEFEEAEEDLNNAVENSPHDIGIQFFQSVPRPFVVAAIATGEQVPLR